MSIGGITDVTWCRSLAVLSRSWITSTHIVKHVVEHVFFCVVHVFFLVTLSQVSSFNFQRSVQSLITATYRFKRSKSCRILPVWCHCLNKIMKCSIDTWKYMILSASMQSLFANRHARSVVRSTAIQRNCSCTLNQPIMQRIDNNSPKSKKASQSIRTLLVHVLGKESKDWENWGAKRGIYRNI